MLKSGLNRDNGLRHDVLNLLPQLIHINVRLMLSNMIKDRGYTTLVPARVVVLVLVEDKIVAILLDRIVR
jgi:hypothetical protein